MHFKELINQVKQRRKVLGVTQIQLAELSGISIRTIKALESHQSNPTLDTISKIADVLGMEVRLAIKSPKNRDE